MSAQQTTQTAATVSTPLLPASGQGSTTVQTPNEGAASPVTGVQDYGTLERGGDSPDGGADIDRRESHPLRVHARDAKVCLTVFFVVCAVFLAAGILRSLGWGDDVVEEPAFGVRAAAYV